MDQNKNVFYLKLHSSPRSNSLPKSLGINSLDIPLNENIYGSFSKKVKKELINFYRNIQNEKILIIEYDGNFIPILYLFWVNIIHKKGFKIFLDCHVNSYMDIKAFSFKTFAKKLIIYTFKNLLNARIIVHNKKSLELFKGSTYCPTPFPRIDFGSIEKRDLCDVFIISSLNKDEPIAEFIKVAKKLNSKGLKTFISGDIRKLKNYKALDKNLFSGFLGKNEFLEYIFNSKVIVAMTIRNNNLLYAPREAIQMSKMCLINDSDENIDFYGEICFYSSPNSESMLEKINEILAKDILHRKDKIDELIQNVDQEVNDFKKCLNTY